MWWRRQWLPTLGLLPGKSHGRRSLVGCSPWGREESDTTERLHFHALGKEMETHSSVLAWRIPGTGEPGGLPSMGSHRVGHNWSDLAAAAAAAARRCEQIFNLWQVKYLEDITLFSQHNFWRKAKAGGKPGSMFASTAVTGDSAWVEPAFCLGFSICLALSCTFSIWFPQPHSPVCETPDAVSTCRQPSLYIIFTFAFWFLLDYLYISPFSRYFSNFYFPFIFIIWY